ncbi:hypothetical protein cce_4789 [Crocosphaera subtropica ATCC 51142]|uniref:Uncharacterized protein n=1 Tax=Crocosphaera subtropica (strain ATCC 51142 / BH68) TaxID=43989 RepID=B1X1X6_CROS5|nr:hypothetical protein [Crocosphaera subtropica]ACB54137.1 hypothetical protein cce_4789 [Crocosphaera subtropica ATCC 51142]
MTQNNEQRTIIEALSLGNEANNQIADAIAARSGKMLEQALDENFETLVEAKLQIVAQEILNIHNHKTQAWAKRFLSSGKTRMAKSMLETQQSHQLSSLQSQLSLEGLDDFDTDLLPEVKNLADESGTITVTTNPSSSIGF